MMVHRLESCGLESRWTLPVYWTLFCIHWSTADFAYRAMRHYFVLISATLYYHIIYRAAYNLCSHSYVTVLCTAFHYNLMSNPLPYGIHPFWAVSQNSRIQGKLLTWWRTLTSCKDIIFQQTKSLLVYYNPFCIN